MENEGEEKNGERGRKTRERRRKRRERRRGEREWHREDGGNEAENTHKGNGKPKDGDRKDGKEQQEEREFGTKDTQGKYRACVRRRTQRRDKREGAKAVKRRRYRDKKDGYNWTEDAHKESTEDAQEATHENTSYILRWKPERQGKDGAPTG